MLPDNIFIVYDKQFSDDKKKQQQKTIHFTYKNDVSNFGQTFLTDSVIKIANKTFYNILKICFYAT